MPNSDDAPCTREELEGKETLPASRSFIISSSLPSYFSLMFCWSKLKVASVLYVRPILTLSPTLPVTLTLIFSSKLMVVVLRFRIGSEGLSIFLRVAPNFSSAVPRVVMRTPPGPKIFSAGPRSKCISVKSNFSLPFASNISEFFWR